MDRTRRRRIAGLIAVSGAAALLLGAFTLARGESLAPRVPAAAGPFPFAAYDALLKRYVDAEGRVDYTTLRAKDAQAVEGLYAAIAATGPDKTPALYPGRDAALAYYLSAYNVLVWKNVIDRQPKQVSDRAYSFFRDPDFQVDGKEADLDDLEKKIIRKRFQDPRVHFALNCASSGCPRLPREAFTPGKVQAQLDREARRFCTERRNVDLDATAGTVRLSMIFKWYKDDFGGDVIAFINKHRPADAQIPATARIEHVEYDWRLNSR